MLEHHTPYRAVPLGVRTESMGWHGNALLVRREFELIGHDLIHLPCLEPRGAVTATLRAGDTTVRVVGMHLDLSGLWRRRQAASLVHHLDLPQLPRVDATILMGDLNEWTASRGCLIDFARHYRLASCGRSYHATRPVARARPHPLARIARLAESGVHHSPAARRASDHLPIWARFERKS